MHILRNFFQSHIDLDGLLGSSETDHADLEMATIGQNTDDVQGSSLAMWETEIQQIELEKGSMGLGFSILDYQVILEFFISQKGNNYSIVFCLPLNKIWRQCKHHILLSKLIFVPSFQIDYLVS